MKHRFRRSNPRFSWQKIREIRHESELGKTDEQIAKIHNCTISEVAKVLKEENYSPSKVWKVPEVDFGKFEDI